jgi:hypothetical protein
MAAVLAAIGAARVVTVAIAGISARRMALPIAVIGFAARRTPIGFAAKDGRVAELMTAARFATGVAIVAMTADETIHHAVFVVTAMGTAVSGNE